MLQGAMLSHRDPLDDHERIGLGRPQVGPWSGAVEGGCVWWVGGLLGCPSGSLYGSKVMCL